MTEPKEKYMNYEWEGFLFPIFLTSIKCENKFYNFPQDSEIKIWRDSEYKLQGEISGIVESVKNLDYSPKNKVLQKGDFVTGETISGINNSTYFLLKGCVLGAINYNPLSNSDPIKIRFKAELLLDHISTIKNEKEKIKIITDWYLCSSSKLLFPRTTIRQRNKEPYKLRHSIDNIAESDDIYDILNSSSSRDFLLLKFLDYNIIVQTVIKEYLPDWSSGILIEYRNDISKMPNEEMRIAVGEFISFILGNQLLNVGTTCYNENYTAIQFYAHNPWGDNIIKKCNSVSFPPIPMNNSKDWFSIEQKTNPLFSEFIINRDSLSFSDCFWKLWIGRDQSLGTNLPILASGLESLIDSYISKNKLIKKYNKKEKKEYRELVTEDVEGLMLKLKPYQFCNFIINKLENPFNFGIGEKMKIFFDSIGFSFDKDSIENQALQARNSMTHCSFNALKDDKIIEIKKLSNAYLTLFYRVILKLLKYEDNYVDYYTLGHPSRKIVENIKK